MELTKKQIERQDFVDNEIQNLIRKLNPTNSEIEWNIENISEIREILRKIYKEKSNMFDENCFYAFLKE
jgi:DNA polymerase sigma